MFLSKGSNSSITRIVEIFGAPVIEPQGKIALNISYKLIFSSSSEESVVSTVLFLLFLAYGLLRHLFELSLLAMTGR